MNKYSSSAASFSHRSRNYFEKSILESFNVNEHFKVALKENKLFKKHKNLFLDLKTKLKSKKDLLDLEIDGIKIGVDIYESILRLGIPTVHIEDNITWEYIYLGLLYFIYFDEMCKNEKIKAFILSHDNYIYMGLPAKIAYSYKIPVFLFNTSGFYKLEHPNQLNSRWALLPYLFNSLNSEEQKKGKLWSEIQLKQRLGGKVGIGMSYQEKSAFEFNICNSQIINNGKINVLVATHEFFDNPHGYGNLLFADFYDWLVFLSEKSLKNNWNLYLKPHRDSPKEEINELIKFVDYNKHVILLNQQYSFHQLWDEGVRHVLTCYGSVGHELPLLGFNVINAGNNPHIGYHFNLHPKSLKEYELILSNLNDLNLEINKSEIFEFYYVSKKLLYTYNFDLENYIDKYVIFNKSEFEIFLLTVDKFKNQLEFEIENFINSNYNFSFQLYNKINLNESFDL